MASGYQYHASRPDCRERWGKERRWAYQLIDAAEAVENVRHGAQTTRLPTFEAYCRGRWGMSRIHAHRMIEAAVVTENLLPIGNIPATERQARPLTQLEPEVQRALLNL